jgi:PAS domain S-box-containing protein
MIARYIARRYRFFLVCQFGVAVLSVISLLVVSRRVTPYFIIFSLSCIFINALGTAKNATVERLKRAHDKLANTLQEIEKTNLALRLENAERHQVYEELKRSEAFLIEGQKISRTGSWRWNPAFGKLIWSDEQFRIFGYQPGPEPPPWDSIGERIHPDDREELRRVVDQAFQDWSRFECEYRIVLPDGTLRYVHGVGYPAPEAYGVREYIGTTVDVTVRRKADEQLRKSEQKFRTLAENSPDGVIRYDLNGRRIYVNPAYIRYSGISGDKALQDPLEANWRADIPVDDYKNILRKVLETGVPGQVFGIWRGQNDAIIHFAINMVAERDSSGAIVGALSLLRNISSLKETQQRLEESQRQLRQLAGRMESVREEERKHLARELHDELAQHLLAVRMRISLLDREFGRRIPALKAKVQDMVGIVDSTIKTVRSVVSTLRPVELDLGILSALERLVCEFMAQTSITCRLHRSSINISLSEEITTAVFRITQEALRNVARHANADLVDVSFQSGEGEHVLEVRDNGSGFDPSIKKALSFGLVGIRERVLMLDGHVEITTAPGEGTSIRVRFPATTDKYNE